MDNVRLRVGSNLRRLREGRGLSQEALAFECGLHRTYISGVERGVRNPTVVVLEKMANALGAQAHELLLAVEVGRPERVSRKRK